MNKYKIIAIFACHTNCIKKYISTLSNINNIYSHIEKFIIIDSQNEEFALRLKNDLKNNNKLLSHYIIKNNVYLDFGKWIHVLSEYNFDKYDNILLINDSIIITEEISQYFNYFQKINKEVNLYAYNDSSQLNIYHYQSYLFMINKKIISKFINFFNSRKEFIKDEKSLIEQMELNLTNIDTYHDCFLKLAKEHNKHKNIFWENEPLYEKLIKDKSFHIFKLKKINDHYKHFHYTIEKYINMFDKNYYLLNYTDLVKFKDVLDLKKHYIEFGFNEGRKAYNYTLSIIPSYCTDKLKELNIHCFFGLPDNFELYYYKKRNPHIGHFSNKECINHFFDYGNDDGTIYYKNIDFSWNKLKNNFYIKQIKFIFNIDITLPYDFILYDYLRLNKNNKLFENKGLLEIICIFYNNKEKYYNILKIQELINVDYFKVIFEELKTSSTLDIIIYFYENFKNKELLSVPKDFNPYIYKSLYNDIKNLSDENLIKDHYIYKGYFEKRLYEINDFDAKIYKEIYTELNNLTNEELFNHYINNDLKEKKIYKLPKDFNYLAYQYYYLDEFENFSKKELIEHYFKIGCIQERKYKLPENFNLENYKKMHGDIYNYNDNELIKHYILIGEKENRIYNIPSDFNPNEYKIIFPHLGDKNNNYIKDYFINEGYRKHKNYKIVKDFDYTFYQKLYPDLISFNKYQLIEHYYNHGFKEGRIYKLPVDFKIDIYRQFNKDYEKLDTFELIRIIISNRDFVLRLNKLPENFSTKIYKNIHDDLKELSDEALKEHYLIFGHIEKRYYCLPSGFNVDEYKQAYDDLKHLNNEQLEVHYLTKGIKENRIYQFPKDFDFIFYKKVYKEDNNLSEQEIKLKYLSNYSKEHRFHKMPINFNPVIYKKLNSDLKHLTNIEAQEHFINLGIHEKRRYLLEKLNNNTIILPDDFDPDYYRKLNPDLFYYNDNNFLINHYLTIGIKEKRMYKLPADFTIENYKIMNKDLQTFNNKDALDHYLKFGINEKRLYKMPDNFDYKFYKFIYFDGQELTNEELKKHYINEGYPKGYFYRKPDDFNVYFYKRLNEDLTNLTDNELLYHFINLGIKEKRPYK
jgi:hypothetical protein